MKKGPIVFGAGISDGVAHLIACAQAISSQPVLMVDDAPRKPITIDDLTGSPGGFARFTKAESKRNRKNRAKVLQRVRSMQGQRKG